MSFVSPVLRIRHPHRFLLRARNHFTTTAAAAAGRIAALATGLPSPFAAHILFIGPMQVHVRLGTPFVGMCGNVRAVDVWRKTLHF